jgi:hypothetical protein
MVIAILQDATSNLNWSMIRKWCMRNLSLEINQLCTSPTNLLNCVDWPVHQTFSITSSKQSQMTGMLDAQG